MAPLLVAVAHTGHGILYKTKDFSTVHHKNKKTHKQRALFIRRRRNINIIYWFVVVARSGTLPNCKG
jgi:hypothetical protein